MKILIVDDSKAMRMIVRRTMRQAGFGDHAYDEVENGAEALKFIQATPPDLVLCDWNMPEMNGIDLLLAIREYLGSMRFVFVTSENTPEMVERASAAGALGIITKPFTADAFKDKLAAIVR